MREEFIRLERKKKLKPALQQFCKDPKLLAVIRPGSQRGRSPPGGSLSTLYRKLEEFEIS
jgi:hypothetical protein